MDIRINDQSVWDAVKAQANQEKKPLNIHAKTHIQQMNTAEQSAEQLLKTQIGLGRNIDIRV